MCNVPQFCHSKILNNSLTSKRQGPARPALQNTVELVSGISPVLRADTREEPDPYTETLDCIGMPDNTIRCVSASSSRHNYYYSTT